MSIARFAGRGVVLFYRAFNDLGCGVTGSLMLSQALYWDQNETAQKRGGWFYKTQDDWTKETGLSRREQETARKRLKELGFIEEKRQGVPAKIWFRVCVNQIDLAVQTSMAESANLDCTNAPNWNGGKRQSITENTAETTTETTSLNIVQEEVSMNDQLFDHFWLHMKLVKKSKPQAKKAFKQLTKKMTDTETHNFVQMLINDTEKRYAINQKGGEFGFDKLHPSTYLNGKRWEDEYDQPKAPALNGMSKADQLRQRFANKQQGLL